jgi:hypothetical protein
MGNTILYAIYTKTKHGAFYRYIMEAPIEEYWAEPDTQKYLANVFHRYSGISKEDEEVIFVEESRFVRYIKAE